MKKLTGSIRFLDDVIYTEYRKYRPPSTLKCKDRNELKKIARTIFEVISEHLLNKSTGVFIKNFGYFFIWKIPRKLPYNIQVKGGKVEECYNYKTGNYMYSPVYLPAHKHKGWSMDNTFNNTFKDKLKDKLLSGFKYKTYLYSLSGLLKRDTE